MSPAKPGKKWDPRNYNSGPGQIFDDNTYAGGIRFIVFFCFAMYVGWHLDEIGRWIWSQFGEVLVVSSAKEYWHRKVVVALCTGGIVMRLLNMHMIFLKRRRKNKEAEIEQIRQYHDSDKTK